VWSPSHALQPLDIMKKLRFFFEMGQHSSKLYFNIIVSHGISCASHFLL
jgi:hypothetical protein